MLLKKRLLKCLNKWTKAEIQEGCSQVSPLVKQQEMESLPSLLFNLHLTQVNMEISFTTLSAGFHLFWFNSWSFSLFFILKLCAEKHILLSSSVIKWCFYLFWLLEPCLCTEKLSVCVIHQKCVCFCHLFKNISFYRGAHICRCCCYLSPCQVESIFSLSFILPYLWESDLELSLLFTAPQQRDRLWGDQPTVALQAAKLCFRWKSGGMWAHATLFIATVVHLGVLSVCSCV